MNENLLTPPSAALSVILPFRYPQQGQYDFFTPMFSVVNSNFMADDTFYLSRE